MTPEQYEKKIQELKSIIREKETHLENLDRIMHAYAKVEKLTNQELMDATEKVRAQEQINRFSLKELQQKDHTLRNVLEVNKNLSSILDEEKLLERIIECLITSLNAQRGVLFIIKEDKLMPIILKNIKAREISKNYFDYCMQNIEDAAKTKTAVYKLFQEFEHGKSILTLSFVCLPLIYENHLLGVIYVDIISDIKTFRVQDLDIAEIFSSQAAISMNNASLYQKIKTQNLELLKLINLKDQLFTDLSKKIKSPLVEIYFTLSQIIKNDELKETESIVELNRIYTEVEKMQLAVDKVLTIQALEQSINDLFIDEVDFNEVFDFLRDYYKDEIEKRKLAINVNLSNDFTNYHANKSILRTIFDEVFSNAIFYNRNKGKINIHGYRQGDFLIVDINDTGHGIKKEDLPKIFQQFYRTESSPELNEKGAGLGLYLVRKFLRYYNGDINATSKYGEGSTFTVKFLIN